MRNSHLAGQPAPPTALIDVSLLIAAYFEDQPDPTVAAQRVAFGTSGHRGSSFDRSFNEWHVLAITQAVCDHRRAQGITGPLFLGQDTHALSVPAAASALEVLAANGVDVVLAARGEYTPTPAISHAIVVLPTPPFRPTTATTGAARRLLGLPLEPMRAPLPLVASPACPSSRCNDDMPSTRHGDLPH